MDSETLESTTEEAMSLLQDEIDRSRHSIPQPLHSSNQISPMSSADLANLRRKFPSLADFSDDFIRSRPMESIFLMESTALKMKKMEQSRDWEDRLAANKMSLADNCTVIPGGKDNRCTLLHRGRFLPGAACSASKLWLSAREQMGLTGMCPIGSYDMGAVGLGGVVTSKGWGELHNPSSSKISLRMFSINNCGTRAATARHSELFGDPEMKDIVELGEFKLALRALRVAANFVMPWNMAYTAIESFMVQTNFCSKDLDGVDKQATILCQFVDYVLGENSNRWRDCEPFLNTGALKSTWEAFFSARPQAALSNKFKEKNTTNNRSSIPKRRWIDICFAWNAGKCLKPAGSCMSSKGTALRHKCNFVPDNSKPDVYCNKDHARHAFH
jgi:hypothetical protein